MVHTSSLSQVLANELLKQWGHEGFFRHIEKVREFYIKRRDFMNSVAKKHLTGEPEEVPCTVYQSTEHTQHRSVRVARARRRHVLVAPSAGSVKHLGPGDGAGHGEESDADARQSLQHKP